jgi:hypothetical protein
MSDPRDDLDELLAPPPGEPSPGLRAEVLRRTERHLARVRWVRRGWRAACAAGLLLAGVAVGWVVRPERERVVEVAGEARTVVVPVLVPLPAAPQTTPSVPHDEPPLTASQAELRAEQADDPAEAGRLYQAAGNAFLASGDYPNATRCYRLFLARAGDSGLSPVPGDTWLLTSLKNDAFREKIHDAPGSD